MKHCRKVGKNMNFPTAHFKCLQFSFLLVIGFIIISNLPVQAQNRTVGVISATGDTAAGYTLFAPLSGKVTYLVDNFGRKINSWTTDKTSGASDYLLEDGSLLRCESMTNMNFNGGGSGGRVKRTSWDGKVMWTYDYSTTDHCQQHDVEYLPNGNILLLAWESKSASDVSAKGRTTSSTMWMDHVVEVKPSGTNGGEIVWEWHVWDHLVQDKDQSKSNYGVISEHPELIDINFASSGADWLHTNAVFYNEEFDQILISVVDLSEVWIIDHSTTKAEAASHSGGKYGKGGDLLYRFGNPAAYKSGTSSDRLLYGQHAPMWIPKGCPGAGNIIVFNNGTQSRGSSVDEYKLPVDSDGKYNLKTPVEKVWSYTASGFFATNLGSAQRLPNGNTLMCQGTSGTFYEVNPAKQIVWKYISPVTNSGITQQGQNPGGGMGMMPNQCFRAYKYAPDFAGFKGKTITPAATPLEGGTLPPVSVLSFNNKHLSNEFSLNSHVTTTNLTSTVTINFTLSQSADVSLKIYSADGREVASLINQYVSAGNYSQKWNPGRFAKGIYFVKLVTPNSAVADRIALLK